MNTNKMNKENGILKLWTKWKTIVTTLSVTLGIVIIIGGFVLDSIVQDKVNEIIDKEIEIRLEPILEQVKANKDTLDKIFTMVMKWSNQ